LRFRSNAQGLEAESECQEIEVEAEETDISINLYLYLHLYLSSVIIQSLRPLSLIDPYTHPHVDKNFRLRTSDKGYRLRLRCPISQC